MNQIMMMDRADCPICLSVASSGCGRYPFRCANGHTLYRGGGATVGPGWWRVPDWSYRPPTRREYVRLWAVNRWPDWPRLGLATA